MNLDFLWQNAIWLVIGFFAARLLRWFQTNVRRRRLRRFFGSDALGETGIGVAVPVLRPLSLDNFDPHAETTIVLKTNEAGQEVRRPIYGEVLHFDDYKSAGEIFALLRELRATRYSIVQDSESLSRWDERPCLVCLGSPFVNATLGELLKLTEETGAARVSGNRATNTLDTYRVVVDGPAQLTLGVDPDHAIGVIWRLTNPAKPQDSIVGVWGDRAESTYATARYFHANFKEIAGFAGERMPLVVLLAIRGLEQNAAELMFAATDSVLRRNDQLLHLYERPSLPAGVAQVVGPGS